jgi:hypothetical protein
MTSVLETLKRVRGIIDTPEKWCQGFDAVDAHGNMVHPTSPDACRRCIWGAVIAAYSDFTPYEGYPPAILALRDTMARESLPGYGPACFNDNHSHAEMLDLIDRTIAHLESEQQAPCPNDT